jgi:hypothetical protein
LSRYEHGWTRFEVGTLRKLAAALGCELRIDLVARTGEAESVVSEEGVVTRVRRLFWDRRLTAGDLERHPVWVVERVLEYGAMEDVRAVVGYYGRKRFLEVVAGVSRVSPRTAAVWRSILEQEGIPCTKKFFRNTAWNS